jgi:molybdate transport system substrate-binding protein
MNPQFRAGGPTAEQIVELLAVPGVDLVGPLPDEIQKVFETSAAVFAASRRAADAEAFLRFLSGPAHAGVFRNKGLELAGAGAGSA